MACNPLSFLPDTAQAQLNLHELLRFRVINARLTTSIMLAAATYFHHACFLGFAAILATVLAIFLGRTVTCPMRALGTWFVSHDNNLLFGVVIVGPIQFWGLI